ALPDAAAGLCRDCPELLPDLQRLMRLDAAARADDRTALSDQSDTSATDLAAAAPVAPGELGGWLAPPDRPDDLGRLGRYRIVRGIRARGIGIGLGGGGTSPKRPPAVANQARAPATRRRPGRPGPVPARGGGHGPARPRARRPGVRGGRGPDGEDCLPGHAVPPGGSAVRPTEAGGPVAARGGDS